MFGTFFSIAVAIASVKAHGFAESIVAGGQTYSGYMPYQDPYMNPVPDRIVRTIPGNGPVEDVTLTDIQCNGYTAGGVVSSQPAALFATVEPGSQLDLKWTTWPESHVGPVITYLARAPSAQDITTWQPGTDTVWFKIDESGLTSDGKWAATDLLSVSNSVYTVTIPQNLLPGQYIVRHEIIALHAAYSYPGAQFYPSCIQIEVTGSGTAFPGDGELVSFPGAYTPDTPGIVFDPYTIEAGEVYPIPGPAVWSGAGGGSGTSSAAPVVEPSVTVPVDTSATVPAETSVSVETSTAPVESTAAEALENTSEAAPSPTSVTTPVETTAPPSVAPAPASSSAVPIPISSSVAPVPTSSAAPTPASSTGITAPAPSSSTPACTTDAYNCCYNAYNTCATQANAAPNRGGNVDFSECESARTTCLAGISVGRRHAREWR